LQKPWQAAIMPWPSAHELSAVMQNNPETVYTVTDYYDGPRAGIANFQGQPHSYQALWDDDEDDWSDLFLLAPIDTETLQWALEDWDIWTRWQQAFHSGQTTIATHPALPEDHDRHKELITLLQSRLYNDPQSWIRVRGLFTVQKTPEPATKDFGQWLVHWLTG